MITFEEFKKRQTKKVQGSDELIEPNPTDSDSELGEPSETSDKKDNGLHKLITKNKKRLSSIVKFHNSKLFGL